MLFSFLMVAGFVVTIVAVIAVPLFAAFRGLKFIADACSY